MKIEANHNYHLVILMIIFPHKNYQIIENKKSND